MSRSWRWLGPVLLIALPMVMLYPLWWNPTSAVEDDVLYYYPIRKLVGEALADGRIPTVDPLVAFGKPVLGDPQAAVLFPTTWLFAVLPTKLAYSLSIFAAFATAGLGAWAYLRRIGLIAPAALFGAIAFEFGGYFVGHRVHLSLIQTGAFLPWGLWVIELLRTRPQAGPAPEERRAGSTLLHIPAVALVLTLPILAGHWPTVIHMALVWGVYFLCRARPLGRSILTVLAGGVLAVVLTAPQWIATLDVMRQATRANIPYNIAAENSYFPLSAVLWLFPFVFGSRWPNEAIPGRWWGPWHLCETLGYVGLATLAIAAAVLWWRRKARKAGRSGPMIETFGPLIRLWFWMGVGIFIFMLGYYLPTYWLVYKIPMLGVVRCPCRMIVALAMGLSTLAAIGVHVACVAEGPLRARILRCARWVVPLAMVVVYLGLLIAVYATRTVFADGYPFPLCASPDDAIACLSPTSPAVLLPFALAILTALVVGDWLRQPERRWPWLIAILLVDLFLPARFVDMQPVGQSPPDPQRSPAAAWLRDNAPDEPFRIWGLGDPYGRCQRDVLLARTNTVFGLSTISTYGPFTTAAYEEQTGFTIYGTNPQWRELLADADRLAQYRVRYVLCLKGTPYDRAMESMPSFRCVWTESLWNEAIGQPARIYENLGFSPSAPLTVPELGFTVSGADPSKWLVLTTLPGGIAVVVLLIAGILVSRRCEATVLEG